MIHVHIYAPFHSLTMWDVDSSLLNRFQNKERTLVLQRLGIVGIVIQVVTQKGW
jgi:hypothetical protein